MPFFDAHKRSKAVDIDYSICQPIDVMCQYDSDGKLTPIYFRATNSDGIRESYNVDAIKSTKDSYGYTIFCCIVINHGMKKDVYLRFYYLKHLWVLIN